MGHHSKVTVKSASSAYVPFLSTQDIALRDAIGTVVSATITDSRRHRAKSINTTTNTNDNKSTGGASTTGAAVAMQNDTVSPDRSTSDYYYYHAHDNATETALFFPLNGTTAVGPDGPFEKPSCHWIAAQQSLFQFANICFLTAFIVPRSYKLSVLSLRALLFVGFLISGLWASKDVCAVDALLWYGSLALINGVHTVRLCKKFLPPALSVELMELYTRLFKPLKVSQKHFRELTREAAIMEMSPGEYYAVEEVSACDERLSILIMGRCSVTCEGRQLHNINSYQFIDSPEWMASTLMHGESMFQVTITAAEDCIYLCWQLSKLSRIFKHRPQLHAVLMNIIGKDITHKMYSLNEQLGQAKSFDDQTRAARNDHWRQAIYRSVSFDAVNTGTKGTVRSNAWKRYRDRKASLFADPGNSPVHGPRRCWIPVMTTQPSNTTTAYTSMDGQSSSADDEREPMLSAHDGHTDDDDDGGSDDDDKIPLYRLDGRRYRQRSPVAAVAIIPVIVPAVVVQPHGDDQPPATTAVTPQRRPGSFRRPNCGTVAGVNREVKFDETGL